MIVGAAVLICGIYLRDQDGAGDVASSVGMQRDAGPRASEVVAGADHRSSLGIQGEDVGDAGITR